MTDALKIGIVGLGQQGDFYTNMFHGREVKPGITLPMLQGGQLIAVCDGDAEKRARIATEFPALAVYADYAEMLEQGGLDAVLIETPHYFHPQMAIDAMARDIHVLVEKPAGVFTNDVQRMNDMAATKPDLKFAMMFNQRTNPLYQKLKALVEDGAIGAIRFCDWTITNWWRPQGYYDMSAWRATWAGEGGGVLINQAPHQIDLWQWICGVPETVFSKAGYGSQRDIAVEDDVVAMVTYAGGATGVFRTCTHDLMGTDRFEILGDRGKIIVEDSSKIILRSLSKPEREISDSMDPAAAADIFKGVIDLNDYISEEVFEFDSVWGQQHYDVIQNFIDAIRTNAPLIAEGREGIRALEITNAMHLSSWLEKEVSLPIDADLYEAELKARMRAEASG
ncbi:MAG: Gfo/Idh/MocA family oxidoreductase [Pseudomonadota bacterium]